MLGKKVKITIKKYDASVADCKINYIHNGTHLCIIEFVLSNGGSIVRTFTRKMIIDAFEKGSSESYYGYKIKTF